MSIGCWRALCGAGFQCASEAKRGVPAQTALFRRPVVPALRTRDYRLAPVCRLIPLYAHCRFCIVLDDLLTADAPAFLLPQRFEKETT